MTTVSSEQLAVINVNCLLLTVILFESGHYLYKSVHSFY